MRREKNLQKTSIRASSVGFTVTTSTKTFLKVQPKSSRTKKREENDKVEDDRRSEIKIELKGV